jgi:hypothetical protein
VKYSIWVSHKSCGKFKAGVCEAGREEMRHHGNELSLCPSVKGRMARIEKDLNRRGMDDAELALREEK